MKAIFTPTELNKTNHTPQATLSPGHTPTKHPARLRCALRRVALLALLLIGVTLPSLAQSVIINGNYFLTHGNNTLSVSTNLVSDFNPNTCIWSINNRRIQAANEAGTAYTGNSYLQTGSINLGGSVQWRTAGANNSNLEATRNNFLNRNGTTAWRISNSTTNRATTYTVTRNQIDSNVDNLIYPTISASFSGNTITFSHGDLSGTFVPQYTRYTFNNTTHNYYDNTDNGSADPTVNASSLTPKYTWSIISA